MAVHRFREVLHQIQARIKKHENGTFSYRDAVSYSARKTIPSAALWLEGSINCQSFVAIYGEDI